MTQESWDVCSFMLISAAEQSDHKSTPNSVILFPTNKRPQTLTGLWLEVLRTISFTGKSNRTIMKEERLAAAVSGAQYAAGWASLELVYLWDSPCQRTAYET